MQQKELLLFCGIKPKWHEKTLEEHTNKDAVDMISKYLTKHREFKTQGLGILLLGPNGTGKTHLMNCAFKTLLLKHKCEVYITNIEDLKNLYTEGFRDLDAREEFDRIKNIPFLGIDDIGKEMRSRTEVDSTRPDLGLAVMDQVLRHRTQSLLPTWFTTNISPDKFSTVYSEDVASLLEEACIPLKVAGGDYRQEILKRNKGLLR